MWFPVWHSGKESTCWCRSRKRCRFDPWVGKVAWRRACQHTPVFLPGKFHGQRGLGGRKASDRTEWLSMHSHLYWDLFEIVECQLESPFWFAISGSWGGACGIAQGPRTDVSRVRAWDSCSPGAQPGQVTHGDPSPRFHCPSLLCRSGWLHRRYMLISYKIFRNSKKKKKIHKATLWSYWKIKWIMFVLSIMSRYHKHLMNGRYFYLPSMS